MTPNLRAAAALCSVHSHSVSAARPVHWSPLAHRWARRFPIWKVSRNTFEAPAPASFDPVGAASSIGSRRNPTSQLPRRLVGADVVVARPSAGDVHKLSRRDRRVREGAGTVADDGYSGLVTISQCQSHGRHTNINASTSARVCLTARSGSDEQARRALSLWRGANDEPGRSLRPCASRWAAEQTDSTQSEMLPFENPTL